MLQRHAGEFAEQEHAVLYCTVGTATLPHSMPVLAPHSMKWMRDTGRQAHQLVHGEDLGLLEQRSSEPLIIRRCFDGSMSHQPW
jgi:hypothetical protein